MAASPAARNSRGKLRAPRWLELEHADIRLLRAWGLFKNFLSVVVGAKAAKTMSQLIQASLRQQLSAVDDAIHAE